MTEVFLLSYWLICGCLTVIFSRINQKHIYSSNTTAASESDNMQLSLCFLFGAVILPFTIPLIIATLIFSALGKNSQVSSFMRKRVLFL
jgi:hypothetical protein